MPSRRLVAIAPLAVAMLLPATTAQAGQVNGSWAQHRIVTAAPSHVNSEQVNGSWLQHGVTRFRPFVVMLRPEPQGAGSALDRTPGWLVAALLAVFIALATGVRRRMVAADLRTRMAR